jgi:membrane associated rhomboid family serine protease
MLSAAFLHGGMFHLFVNMFVLYGFGEFVERKFTGFYGEFGGKVGFLIFYLFMAVCANIPTYLKNKENYQYHSIGASGATSGIVFSYILFEPTSMLYLFLAIPIPAIIFGVLYLLYSSYASKTQADHIDHDAHFYGAVAGFLFTLALKPDLFSSFIFKITHWF